MSEPSAGRSTHLHSDWATRTSTSLHQWNNALLLQDSGAFQSAITAHWHLSLVTSDERYTTPEEWPTSPPLKIAVYFLIDTLCASRPGSPTPTWLSPTKHNSVECLPCAVRQREGSYATVPRKNWLLSRVVPRQILQSPRHLRSIEFSEGLDEIA